MKIIARGAEAIVYDDGDRIIKERLEKKYRIPEIDNRLIKSRNKKEANILRKLANLGIKAPRLLKVEGNRIYMEKIVGRCGNEWVNDDKVLYKIGILVSELHKFNIIHGDLTSLNFIVNSEVYVIDFGLSFISSKDEDKAVDLYVFEKSLICGHTMANIKEFYEGYSLQGSQSVLDRLEKVRLRGRKRE